MLSSGHWRNMIVLDVDVESERFAEEGGQIWTATWTAGRRRTNNFSHFTLHSLLDHDLSMT